MSYENVPLGSKIYDDLVKTLRESFPNACVLYIDKIVNQHLVDRFEQRKNYLESTEYGSNEMILYHGTTEISANLISKEGYKSSLNKRSVYGPGTYFSSAGSYSKLYTDVTGRGESFMLVNRVLLGNFTKNAGIGYTCDSNGDGSTIFVVKNDESILPEYVICFHKNAKN